MEENPTEVDMVTEDGLWNMWDTEYNALAVQQSSQMGFVTDDNYEEVLTYQSDQLVAHQLSINSHADESAEALKSDEIGALEFHYEMTHQSPSST